MNKKNKGEFSMMVTDALNDVMIPALENMEERLKSHLASKEELQEVKMKVESLNRKFDAQQDRLDRHGKDIEKIKSQIAVN